LIDVCFVLPMMIIAYSTVPDLNQSTVSLYSVILHTAQQNICLNQTCYSLTPVLFKEDKLSPVLAVTHDTI